MSDPGRMRHRLVLEAPVEVADGAGGVTRSFTTVATVWAEIEPLSAREAVAADDLGVSATHRITIRAGMTVTSRHRFLLGARVLQVSAVRDPDETGRFLEVLAHERTD